MPTLAQINWTAAISGKVTRAIHSVAYPRAAPAMAYVPIPEGSSSEAPVIRPGPSDFRKRRSALRWPTDFDRRLSHSVSEGPAIEPWIGDLPELSSGGGGMYSIQGPL